MPLATWSSSVTVNSTTFDPNDPYNVFQTVGFRLKKAVVVDAEAMDQNGDAHLTFIDASLYLSDDAANLRTEQTISIYGEDEAQSIFDDFRASHPMADAPQIRPLAIELFEVDPGTPSMPTQGHSVTWVRDGSPVAWRVVGLKATSDMVTEITNWGSDGYRLLSLSSRELSDGDMQFVGLFVKDNIEPSDTDYEVLVDPGGFHLVSSTPYPSRDNQVRWAGVWHKYDNIFRTDATEYDQNVYAEDNAVIWSHFDDQITDLMSGSVSDERIVPSCTFAALDGADVVYQKSYTFAPSI